MTLLSIENTKESTIEKKKKNPEGNKQLHQGRLLNLYAEYIMGTSGLDEGQAGIKIVWQKQYNIVL